MSALSTRGTKSPRIGIRDRTWLPFSTVRAAGPLDVPTVTAVRDLLARTRQQEPGHPLLCRVDQVNRRLVPAEDLGALLDEVVLVGNDDDPTRLVEQLQAAPLGDLPFRLLLGRGAAAMQSAHVLGDGAVANAWFSRLLAPALGVPGSLGPDSGPGRAFPLLRAAGRHFGRRPARAVRALVTSFPLTPPTGAASRPAVLTTPSVLSATMASTELERLRQWRDQHTPGVTTAATVMAATLAALRGQGLLDLPGVFVMMDCRRYLPQGDVVRGNFATGPYLVVDDPADPRALGQRISAAGADGVPLLLLVALTLRNLVGLPPADLQAEASVPARARITLSYQGRLGLEGLPWSAATGHQYLIAGAPAGPEGVTICFATSPGGLHLTAAAHPSVLDVVALQGALDQVCGDPQRLLEGLRQAE